MQTIQRQLREDGICILTFDRPGSPANIFDRGTLEDLTGQIEALAQSTLEVKGLVFLSAKPAIFVAGADLRAIAQMRPPELEHFIELGQKAFSAIAALSFPTVAAIHGACVGGGYELTLACDWRVATDEKVTRIGLPETKLGILPAWGGCTRLPRLIGLAPALDIILGGKTPNAKGALKKGMIDGLAPREHLLEAALPFLARGKRHPARTWKDAIGAPFIFAAAQKRVAAKTRGHYPAIAKALEVAVKASGFRDEKLGLELERKAVLELAQTGTAAQLIRLFFLQERAKKLAFPGAEPGTPIQQAAVIGAGVMGAGIAQWLSSRGVRTILRDINAERVATGMGTIGKLYAEGVKHHSLTAAEARRGAELIAPAPAEVPLTRCDLVVEAAVEKMEVKKAIFQRLDQLAGRETILATNTSALSIAELARATAHPERVIGLHFFNPVHQMQLVEVIVAPETAPAVAARVLRFVQAIGKLPVLVKDSPGFLVNRILLPGMVEAVDLFSRGVGAEEIDAAALRFGMPMGPLRLTDEVGVEVAEDVATTLTAAFPGWMRTPPLLTKMVQAGALGRKAKQGFYRYGKSATPEANPEIAQFREKKKGPPMDREEIAQRLILPMINEAARCLEEKIIESPADVDFAMVMGTGFAPFRGGPLRYADALGVAEVVRQLDVLAANEPRFQPCALLREMAQKQSSFYEDSTPPPAA